MARRTQTLSKHASEARWHACQVWNISQSKARVFFDPDERESLERALAQVMSDLETICEVLSGEYRRKKAERSKADPSP